MTLSLDATYSLGDDLSGVGVYSREILLGLAAAHPECRWRFYYRPHRLLRAFRTELPRNCRRALLHDLWPPSGDLFHGLNQRLPLKRPRHTVTTFHDLFVLTGEYSTPEFRRRFAEQARHTAENSDLILAVSAFTAGQVHELLGVERGRLRVVHHGAPLPRVATEPREKVILHVGAIQKRKNIARLVKAFESVDKEWRLVLAGGCGYGGGQILRGIESSPARERIHVLGYVPSAELSHWYARASLFAFPSLDEGFGMPVLEAMAAGIPVVTSNRSALPEVAGEAAVLVNPEDTGELAEALGRLTRDEAARAALVLRGLKHAADFTWVTAVDQTWGAYQAILR